ncbi:MAG: H+transporting two-sector ATPase C subunit [Candidatus Omnitrophica bacterium]|nr:H+transporting two-sector ATPase C subunit [Candidatus Omnitrophota bacterium]
MGTMQDPVKAVKRNALILVAGGALLILGIILASSGQLLAQVMPENVKLSPETAKVMSQAFLSAAIAVVGGSVAAGIAVAYVGAAAVGAVTEKPEILGRVLIFVGLAEGIAIYGLIIAIMILQKI